MLALLPGLALVSLWILLGNLWPGWGWRRSLLRAAVIAGSYAILVAEVLSLMRGISQPALLVAWGIPLVASMGWLVKQRGAGHRLSFPRPSWPEGWPERAMLLGVGAIVVVTGVVAWFAPPNTYDSLNYHMARVAHWAQNRSLQPYATGIEWQNGNAPGSEIMVLHLYVLAVGDRLANFVQWGAMLLSVVGVSLVASELGGGRFAQVLAALMAATLPMGIAQASSTMTDYVATVWLVCAVCEVLGLWVRRRGAAEAGFLGLAAALAVVSKPISYPYLAPLAVWGFLGVLRAFSMRRVILVVCAAILSVSLLNAGHMGRNLELYGTPVGVPQLIEVHRNELFGLAAALSGVLKHAGMHAGTPWVSVNSLLFRGIVSLHDVINLDPNDPRTTSIGQFYVYSPRTSEVVATNWLHAWLYLFVLLVMPFWARRRPASVGLYAGAVVAGFVLFSALFKWQVFSARYHLPFFVLFAPAASVVLVSRGSGRRWLGAALGFLLLVGSWPCLAHLRERPLLTAGAATASVVTTPREWLYMGREAAEAHVAIVDRIQEASCTRVGVMLGGNGAEYPLWVFLGAPWSGVRLEWIVAGTPSARYAAPDFEPCAVVCDESCPSEWTEAANLPLAYKSDGLRLFMQGPSE